MPRKPSKPKPSPTRTVRRWCVWSEKLGGGSVFSKYHRKKQAEANAAQWNKVGYGMFTDWQPRRCTVTVEVEKGGKSR